MHTISPLTKGDLFLVHFPVEGVQKQGLRPVVIVQSDAINLTSIQTTLVCPLTTVLRGLKSHPELEPSPLNGLNQRSAIVCEQVTVLEKSAVQKRIGRLSSQQLEELEDALLFVFDIDVF